MVSIKRKYIIFGTNKKTNKREVLGYFVSETAQKALRDFKRSKAGSVAVPKYKKIAAQR